jgi:hypothetical protein
MIARIGQIAGMRSRSISEPSRAVASRGGSRTRARITSATAPVIAASPRTVSRQPKASTAADRGRDEATFPSAPTPIVTPASVPKIAGEKLRAKMK